MKGGDSMTDKNESRLKELEEKKSNGSITPEEETVRTALLELDERSEDLDEAKKANPVPDPVAAAQAEVDKAQKAYDDAEAAISAK